MTTPSTVPPPTAAEQVHEAVAERPDSDYRFHFWTAFGWTLLTLGIFSYYVFYQLVRRSRDHNRRRARLLDGATGIAWERALEQGRAEALRPAFDQVRRDVDELRRLDGPSRDPVLWLVGCIIGPGVVWAAGAVFLDQELVRHERHERAAESELTRLFADLGVVLPTPEPAAKQPHNYVGRLLAVIFTLGLYSLWWVADLMREGNANYAQDQEWEDAVAAASAGTATPPA